MFKVYTLTDGMVGDLVATHNESDAHVYANALELDYSEPGARDVEVAVVVVEDDGHVPADVIGPEARVVREHTITADATCSHCGTVLWAEDCPNYGYGEVHA